MRKIALALLALSALSAVADEYVPGYYRKDGTYVQGYHRTTPDSNPYNNYSTQGNVNPYTGQAGTVNPHLNQQPQQLYQQQVQPVRVPVCGYNGYGQYVCR